MANTCASKFLQAQGIVKPYTAVMMIMVLPVRSLDLSFWLSQGGSATNHARW